MYCVFFYLMQLMAALMTKGDNTIFAHYIFMDNEFFLPTLTGVPLRIALSGTFTPGIKGGLKIARDMVIIHVFKCHQNIFTASTQYQLMVLLYFHTE